MSLTVDRAVHVVVAAFVVGDLVGLELQLAAVVEPAVVVATAAAPPDCGA